MRKLTPIQTGFLTRTFVLVVTICGLMFASAAIFFESAADFKIQIAMSIVTAVSGLLGGWLLVIRPMSRMIREDVEQRHRDFSERFKEIIDSMQESVVVFDQDRVVHWNRSSTSTLALSIDDMQATRFDGSKLKFTN